MGENYRLFINSMPKSGTHLLIKTIELLGYQNFLNSLFKKVFSKLGVWVPSSLIYESVNRNISFWLNRRENYETSVYIGIMSPVAVPYSLAKKWLQKVNHGFYIAGHVPYTEIFKDLLDDLNFKHILIIRDPRDVIVSMAHYMARPDYSSKSFKRLSFEDRVKFLMNGGVLDNRHFMGLKEAYKKALQWKESDCLIVRFEDLVGLRGGGTEEVQKKSVYQIATYLGILEEGFIKNCCHNIYDPSSPTFRRGKIGAWMDEFPENLLEKFNTEMEEVLRALGYDV
jgi:hypothetical protein